MSVKYQSSTKPGCSLMKKLCNNLVTRMYSHRLIKLTCLVNSNQEMADSKMKEKYFSPPSEPTCYQ